MKGVEQIVNFTKLSNFFSVKRFSNKKQTFFAKRLSFLIMAGVPILESIQVIQKQAKTKSEIEIFEKISLHISNGNSLAVSLNRLNGVFDNFAINIIKAGESSGNLTTNLSYLADELRKKHALKSKILSAMLYPIIVTIATFGITGLLIVYIFPKILPIFQSLNAKLPLSTQIVIFVSDSIRNYGIYIFILLALSLAGFIFLVKTKPKVALLTHRLILAIPFLGLIVRYYNLTNLTRTLGLLIQSGVSLDEALIITSETMENLQYREALLEASATAIQGKNISEFFESSAGLFPDILTHMIAVGEKSGNLPTTLLYLSDFYENEFNDLTKNLSSAIEPVLMIIMGLLVGFIAISVVTPIYEITNSIKK